MTVKNERLDMILQREISNILQFDLKNPKLGFVTVTDVQCTRDLSQAKVYVTFLGKQERNDAGMKILKQSKGFIRSTLAKQSGKCQILFLFRTQVLNKEIALKK